MKARGLGGVVLITSDDHAWLRAAIARHFQGASWQRCQVHFARNLLGRVGLQDRAQLADDLRAIFAAPTAAQARDTAHSCAERWRASHAAVAVQREAEVENCLACYHLSPSHRLRVRTTNRAALLRLVTDLAMEQSEEWVSGRRYLDMDLLKEVPAPAAMPDAQAA